MQRIRFISRHQAEHLQPEPGRSVLVSIYDRSECELRVLPGWRDVLYQRFHDSDGSHLGLEHFSVDNAVHLLDFVSRHLDANELVVHCQMGKSRSAAVALFFSKALGVPCFAKSEPVTLENYKVHNRRVYETLALVLQSKAGLPFREAAGL